MTQLGVLLRDAVVLLGQAGIESASLEARLVMAHALGVERNVVLDRGRDIDPAPFDKLLKRRLSHEPLAYITGRQGFWTLDLAVSPETLIPRADSETLVSAAIEVFAGRPPGRILDLGTGTGCLLLASLVVFPGAFGVGVDLAPGAVSLARRNAEEAGLAGCATFVAGSWADCLSGQFDLVLSNPPYIPAGEVAALMPEVAWFEPARALDGGADGLDAYHALATVLPRLLTESGRAIVELGAGQLDPVCAMFASAGLDRERVANDLGGIARALVLRPQKTFGSAASSG